MFEIRRITTDDPLFGETRRLRQDVLLAPLGLTLEAFDAAVPGLDSLAEHHVCVMDHPRGPRIIACAMLIAGEPDADSATIAQVVVDPQRQGEGIGKRLLATIESRVFGDLGLQRLICVSHMKAIGFYEAMGWQVEGAPFDEAGVPHQRMALSSLPAGPVDLP